MAKSKSAKYYAANPEARKVKAKKDRRSLSNYIITLIEKDVREMVSPEDAAKLGQKKK